MAYTAQHTVRSYECDSYGHVNNAVYLNYLEYARIEYLHDIKFDYNGMVKAGYYLYVTHIDIFYKASAFLDDVLSIEVVPIKMKAVSGIFHQTVRKPDGSICAEADVSWASVSAATQRPTKLPQGFLVHGLYPED